MANKEGDFHHVTIGGFNESIYRRPPFKAGVDRWLKEMSNMKELKDYDIMLAGSYPSKNAQDVDIIFKPAEATLPDTLDHKALEKVFYKGLEMGLKEEGIFFDTSVSISPLNTHDLDIFNYLLDGNTSLNESLTYGPQIIVDGRVYRDYGKDGKQYSDFIFERTGHTPSKKQLRTYMMDRKVYDNRYAGKPLIIKPRQKIYAT